MSTDEKTTTITFRCSFCGKGQQQLERLIAGPGGVYICDECVALCTEIIRDERAEGHHGPPQGPPF